MPKCVTVAQNRPGHAGGGRLAVAGRWRAGFWPVDCLRPLAQGAKCAKVCNCRTKQTQARARADGGMAAGGGPVGGRWVAGGWPVAGWWTASKAIL